MVYVVIVLTLLGALFVWRAQEAEGQTAYVKIDKDSDIPIDFDHTLLDITGVPVVVNAAEFIFRIDPPPTDPTPPGRSLILRTIVSGENRFISREVFVSIPIGTYMMSARVQSEAGAFSDESNQIPIEVTAKKPSAPLRLRAGGGS